VPVPPAASLALTMDVAPSVNVTVPVGLPAPGAAARTVAVRVTAWPTIDGLTSATTAVVVAAWPTTWFKVNEVLPTKTVSPPYEAVMEWEPTERLERVKVACPAEVRGALPRTTLPSE